MNFPPHLTLVSTIDTSIYGTGPQSRLDSIPCPAASVRFEGMRTQDLYYRPCFIKCDLDGVREVADMSAARGKFGEESISERTEKWLTDPPYLFGGNTAIGEAQLKEVVKAVQQVGIVLGESTTLKGSVGGCDGGEIWLIHDWKLIAKKSL